MRKIVVVGCSGGIGLEVVRMARVRDWSVVGIDQVRPDGIEIFEDFYEVDLRDVAKTAGVLERISLEHPAIWGVVHCAGVYPIVSLKDYSLELWNEVISVNLQSAFIVARMLYRNVSFGGRFVFVSSAAAFLGSADVAYSASKSGVVGLVRGLCKAFASSGLLVNAVCPGPITSGMSGRMSASSRERYIDMIPLGRFGSVSEVASPILFLLEPSNSFMTGAVLDVSGGLGMH